MKKVLSIFLALAIIVTGSSICFGAAAASRHESSPGSGMIAAIVVVVFLLLCLLLIWALRFFKQLTQVSEADETAPGEWLTDHLSDMEAEQIEKLINIGDKSRKSATGKVKTIVVLLLTLTGLSARAQSPGDGKILGDPGIIIMLSLVFIILLVTGSFMVARISASVKKIRRRRAQLEAVRLVSFLGEETDDELREKLLKRRQALSFKLTDTELAGMACPSDNKGIIGGIGKIKSPRFFAVKKKAAPKHNIDPKLVTLILWYLGSAAIWLVLGTSIGEYLGIKFTSPDIDHIRWLSFGRLRPVHVNMVFWGWSSLAMVGLGYYVVPTVSNTKIASIRFGYYTLALVNGAVILGSICLVAGINNSGGEYREYIWPVMGLFAGGIVITLVNYMRTIAMRRTTEIYISNWYIMASVMFVIVIVIVGYAPWWQNGLGETIVQGYYMHQAVGMWFMLFNLGLLYYFLPQQLNTPIYSYSLGILAFWSQILFYTLIGTHHFLFSSIPWWLQTTAIIASVGMLIPVFSGTTNFLMTFRGSYGKIGSSYTLPFYLTGILFYFTGSTQGTAEAFRSTNLIWHFTDFTVAHSHLTMYGIIAFILWACIYTIVPRLTGREPKQGWVGAHFWLALIGLLFYTIPLMIGGTLKGMSWVAGQPFIKGVVLMAPYWLWRAIGGSLMWISHLVFARNLYMMMCGKSETDIDKETIAELAKLEPAQTFEPQQP